MEIKLVRMRVGWLKFSSGASKTRLPVTALKRIKALMGSLPVEFIDG